MSDDRTGYFIGSDLDAISYGAEEAIILGRLRHWVKYNKANKNMNSVKPDENGVRRYWVYASLDSMVVWFPYWNRDKIRRLISSLIKQGAIMSGSFNDNRFDRTGWYTINDDSSRLPIVKGAEWME